ncbi:MAG: holo-[acyl-carrier-protein] synthase [Calditrichaeota bacterium]|nr:holo-[acyl-carrier-protein] synthase [Calditrichota bacterium]
MTSVAQPTVGIDLVEVERIARLRQSERFLKRIYTERELADCRKRLFPERALAARFAAKEATAKALGTGIGKNLHWKEIELTTDTNKQPHIRLHGKWADEPVRISVSITHTRTTAGAVVMIFPWFS